ncbi:MAG: hypothetical protein E7620_07975 [Ruminococcaceae bacterium]|nr:hypothetical protein [Oscillospiraceae bacterium]
MKPRIFKLTGLLLSLALLLPLSACASKAIHSVTVDGKCYEALGGSLPKKLRVSENGKTIWQERVKTDKTLSDAALPDFGFAVIDLNFDGYADIRQITHVEGEMTSNVCFLYDPATNTFLPNEPLGELCNVMPDPEKKVILSFTHQRTDFPAYTDAPSSYKTCDTTTAYYWKNGNLIPYRRISLTYSSEHNIYMLSISDYVEEIFQFLDPDDTWYTPEELEKLDLSGLYYFR